MYGYGRFQQTFFSSFMYLFYLFAIGPAVLSSDMTSAYVLYFPAAATAPPPIFPNHTNYQIF